MLLSIIITTYNSNDTIQKCLDSVLVSNSNLFEVIVVDDCSCTPCEDIVLSFADDRIRYMFNPSNVGCGQSRNFGVHNSRGEFVTFIDADDWYEEGAVDFLISQASDCFWDLMVFNFYIVYENSVVSKQWLPSREGIIKDFLTDRLVSTVWNKVYRSSIIKEHKIKFPSYHGEDSVFNFQFLLRCQRITHSSQFLYYFDKTGESITRSQYTINAFLQARQALNDMDSALKIESSRLHHSLYNHMKLRRFLFLFKDPVIRMYRDWSSKKLDDLVLCKFKVVNEITFRDVAGLKRFGLLSNKEFLAFVVFWLSPRFLFFLMRCFRIG